MFYTRIETEYAPKSFGQNVQEQGFILLEEINNVQDILKRL